MYSSFPEIMQENYYKLKYNFLLNICQFRWVIFGLGNYIIRTNEDQGEAQNMHITKLSIINTLRPRQNGCHFLDDVFKCIFLNENVWIWIKISLKFVPKGPHNNIPSLVQIMAWRRPGDKPLSEAMIVSLLTHICITVPQWVKFNPSSRHWKLLRMKIHII